MRFSEYRQQLHHIVKVIRTEEDPSPEQIGALLADGIELVGEVIIDIAESLDAIADQGS